MYMVQLEVKSFIEYLKTERHISDITARNYDAASKRLGLEVVDTEKITELFSRLSKLLDEDTANKKINEERLRDDEVRAREPR